MKSYSLLFLVANLYLCACDDVEKAFKTHEIVADVIDSSPSKELEVEFKTTSKEADFGNELQPKDVREKPHIDYKEDDKAYYTLAMVDPDAPTRKNPIRGEFLHWLVVNIPGEKIEDGETIAEYVGSGPPKDTGLHRYTFLLYKQPDGKITVDEPRQSKTQATCRPNFSIKKFAEKYKLGHPIAGNFYQAQYDETVPELHKQLGAIGGSCPKSGN